MRSVLLVLIIFTLAVSTSVAEKKENTSKPQPGFKKEKVLKMRSGKFGRIFLNMMHKARNLDLNDEQKKELNSIKKTYLSQILTAEKSSYQLQAKFMSKLESKEYNPTELKTLSVEIQQANLRAADSFIDGLSEIEKLVGDENFAKLYPISKISRSVLVQLREGSGDDPASVQRTADKETKSEAENK